MATGEKDSISKLNKQLRSVTTGKDIKEEMALVMTPHTNWEQYLVPAPLSIALLGDLMLITNDTDFSLENAKPEGGFKFMRYPSSFRASLAQVSNAGWDAFNEAHKNMDQIRLHSANVPVYLEKTVNILMKGTSEDIENVLPIPLRGIKHIADQCLHLAQATEDRFIHVMNLTAEILEACTSAKCSYEDDLRETKIALKVAKEHEKAVQEERSMAQDQLKEIKKEIQSAEKTFEEAMKSIPSGWELIGMSFVEGLSNGVKNVLNGMSSIMSRKEKVNTEETGKPTTTESTPSQLKMDKATLKSLIKVCSKAEVIQSLSQMLQTLIQDDDSLNEEELRRGECVSYVAVYTGIVRKEIGTESISKMQIKAADICNKMIGICKDLKEMKKGIRVNETELIVERIRKVNDEAMEFMTEAKVFLGSTAMDGKPPKQAMWSSKGDGNVVQSIIENGKYKLEHASQHLQNVKESQSSSYDKLVEANKKLTKVLSDMAKLDIQEINFEQIRKMLIKGMKALGEVRHQWGKMVRFFQMMSNIIECSLSSSLNNFVEYVKKGEVCGIEGYNISDLVKDMIYQEAFEAAKIAYMVNSISGVYVEVSSKYIMDRVSSLGTLLGLDPETDKALIIQERQKLHNGCKDAQRQIESLVLMEKDEFNHRINKRISQLKQNLDGALPMISAETSNRIQKSVAAGISASKELTP
ncbi:uncharacterized protein LOC106475632 [Limulus polyphemus]|uniref:Uncharacterized protein LOC106475632 n=1 Tax=Limulus polyphemus TaxID=6850 RepID=A0ABM1BZV2_LIMPO|nr:uncharacterized protein LOC106475632 [Limulus polyphemus]XP_022235402.1 uncharacterized protein LOC106475632 [Limulus polyphemus]